MRVRLYELRLIAAFLCGLWVLLFLAVLAWYHPGGPVDVLVAVATLLPAAIAALAVGYPPLARGDRASVLMGWLGILACLLLIPVLLGVAQGLTSPTDEALVLPSAGAIYAGAVTLLATCLFAGLGLSRRALGETALRQRRLLLGVAFALALTAVSGAVLGGLLVANSLALSRPAVAGSAYGPVDPAIDPPHCDGSLAIGPWASVHVDATATVDRRQRGSSGLDGQRSGQDEQWTALGTRDGLPATRAYVHLGDDAWSRTGTGAWRVQRPPTGSTEPPPTLDGAVLANALTKPRRVAAEDAGLEEVGGALARHCRTLTTGSLATASFPELAWLAESNTPGPAPNLADWRGELDWWVFADGELGVARVKVSGLPPNSWPGGGVQGTLEASLTALLRDVPQTIGPAPSTGP
ncbi:MAG: hypothetical protein ACXVAE_02890 [Candidatus Limnocylindrales bacterium]